MQHHTRCRSRMTTAWLRHAGLAVTAESMRPGLQHCQLSPPQTKGGAATPWAPQAVQIILHCTALVSVSANHSLLPRRTWMFLLRWRRVPLLVTVYRLGKRKQASLACTVRLLLSFQMVSFAVNKLFSETKQLAFPWLIGCVITWLGSMSWSVRATP